MSFLLPNLPFDIKALEPHLSENLLSFHYGKHHRGYLDKLNELTHTTAYESLSLEDVILKSFQEKNVAIFNNAAQVFNHTFYWNCLSPTQQTPSDKLIKLIDARFASFEAFKREFETAALTQFGSGWVWLVQDQDNALKIVKTTNAETPLTSHQKPLLTCDVWEHAYYLDYQNRRPDYVHVFLEKLVNWSFVESNI